MAYQIIRGPPGQPLPDSPLDPLCRFTKKELTMMMKQIFDFDNRNGNTFWTANSHIPRNRHDEIRRRILGPLVDQALTFNTWSPDWPEEFAIFSPYAATKGEESGSLYSQVRFSGDKKKWYCHRAAYVHQHGPQSLGANQEISHARYLGKRTSRNINPRHSFAESGPYNKARHHCHLYISVILSEVIPSAIPDPYNPPPPSVVRPRLAQLFNESTMPTCHKLHGQLMCSVDLHRFLEDTTQAAAADDYESVYETDTEAVQRLSAMEEGEGDSEFGPNSRPWEFSSSFGHR